MPKHTRAIMMQINTGEVAVALGEIGIDTLIEAIRGDTWIKRPLRTLLKEHIDDTEEWLALNPKVCMPDLEPLRQLLLRMAHRIKVVQTRHPNKFHKFEGTI